MQIDIRTKQIKSKGEPYNLDELRHIAVNYAISCEKGYTGTFDEWFDCVNRTYRWRKIANDKH